MRRLIYRPMILAATLISLGVAGAMGVLVAASWRSLHRIELAHRRLGRLGRLQQAELALQRFEDARAALEPARRQVRALIPGAVQGRADLEDVVRRLTPGPTSNSAAALRILHGLVERERTAVAHVVDPLGRTVRAELAVSATIIVALPLASLLLVALMRRTVVLPLRNLGRLMERLAEQDYRSVPLDSVDPFVAPLYLSYNHLVNRLAELDHKQHELQSSLRGQVRRATRTLLAQQRSLARAERLAVVGEVAAGLAHELRNPLAGLQVALGNLRGELSDLEQRGRLDRMLAEVRRMVQLLNSLLECTPTAPETEVVLEVAPAVEELLALVRYQLPERIALENAVPAGMRGRLPRSRLHQAMLNLVLNAAQAIGEQPGRITISASRQGNALQLSVEDNGPGLPEELVRRGVRPFARWREEGTGLGLAVVRRFVQDLGGALQLANRPEGGARVTLVLPCEVTDA